MAMDTMLHVAICKAAVTARLDAAVAEWSKQAKRVVPTVIIDVVAIFSASSLQIRQFQAAVSLDFSKDYERALEHNCYSTEQIWLPDIEVEAPLIEPYFDAMGQCLAWRTKQRLASLT